MDEEPACWGVRLVSSPHIAKGKRQRAIALCLFLFCRLPFAFLPLVFCLLTSHPASILLQLLTGRARFVTHLVGWLSVFFLFFYLLSGLYGPREAFGRVLLNLVFLLALFYGNARWIVNRYLEKGRPWSLIGFTALIWLGASALRAWLEVQLYSRSLLGQPMAEVSAVQLFLRFALSYFLLLLFSSLYQLLENRYLLELRHRELQTRHAEAQLNYLKAHISPHFLFNALNNIYAAATLQHPKTAEMVLRLSELLRYVTYDAPAAQVPLSKEVAQIKAYLELYRLRSDTALQIGFMVEGDPETQHIEPLLFLPLVENALKHGDLDTHPQGFLQLQLACRPDRIFFEVKNSFDPANRQKDSHGGVGLDNVRRRLALHYPGRHTFEALAEGGVFQASLMLYLT